MKEMQNEILELRENSMKMNQELAVYQEDKK